MFGNKFALRKYVSKTVVRVFFFPTYIVFITGGVAKKRLRKIRSYENSEVMGIKRAGQGNRGRLAKCVGPN